MVTSEDTLERKQQVNLFSKMAIYLLSESASSLASSWTEGFHGEKLKEERNTKERLTKFNDHF